MERCVRSIISALISLLIYTKAKFAQNTSHCYNSHFFFTALYSAPSFSHTPLSVTELITTMLGDQFQRQHESQKYQSGGFLQDIHILCQKENLSLGAVISLLRNQLLFKYLQYYFDTTSYVRQESKPQLYGTQLWHHIYSSYTVNRKTDLKYLDSN